MKLKQKIYALVGLVSLVISFSFVLFSGSSVQAYTCAYSGNGGNGMEGQYKLEMGGNGGNCYYMVPDDEDNSKRTEIFENGRATGRYQCTGGTVMHDDGNCWTYEKKYTDYKPTYDDGSEIPDSVFQAACQQQGSYYGAHYNYDSDNHSCAAGTGCLLPSNNETDGPGIKFGGSCRKVGDDTKTAGDVLGSDPTAAKIKECTDANLTWNTQTKDCNWTQDTCSKKNSSSRSDGGNGIWVNGTCKAYSDFNETDCKKANPPGVWTQDPNDATHWECVKPGGEINSNGDDEADCAAAASNSDECATIEKTSERCGEARVNLLSCGNERGAKAFNNILKIIIQVLTVLVGIAAVGGLAYASLTYARAEDNSGTVSEARTLIRNIVIGIVLYGFLIAIVTWLVPGLSLT